MERLVNLRDRENVGRRRAHQLKHVGVDLDGEIDSVSAGVKELRIKNCQRRLESALDIHAVFLPLKAVGLKTVGAHKGKRKGVANQVGRAGRYKLEIRLVGQSWKHGKREKQQNQGATQCIHATTPRIDADERNCNHILNVKVFD